MRFSGRSVAATVASLLLWASAVACGPASQPAPAAAPAGGQPAASAPAPGAPSAPAAAAVPGPGNQGTPKRGGVWHTAQNGDPPTVDVHATSLGLLTAHTRRTHNRLTRYDYGKDKGLVVVGDLAEKWEASSDAKTWTFTLRKGVKFHNIPPVNGRELVADDVKFSYERIKTAPSSIWKGQYDFIDRIEAVDKYTVRFHLKVVNASMLYRTSDGEAAWIVAKEVVEQPDYGKDPKKSLIGTGPFLFDSYDRGVALSEKRNPDYFGTGFTGLPYLDGVEQLVINDAGAQMAAFISKQIDNINVAKKDVDRVKGAVPGVDIRTGSSGEPYFIINVNKAPWDNVKVRQAVKHGINQQRIVDDLFQGSATWNAFIPAGKKAWTLSDQETKQLYRHDPELSKKLLTEAGHPNGFKSEVLLFTQYNQENIDIAEAVVADLKKIGVDLAMKLEPVASGRKAVEEGNYLTNVAPHVTGLEPDEFVKDGLVPGGSRNFMRLNDSVINDLAAKQTGIVDVVERKKVVDEISRRVAETAPIIPLPGRFSFTAVQPYLKNYFPEPTAGDECIEQFFWIDK